MSESDLVIILIVGLGGLGLLAYLAAMAAEVDAEERKEKDAKDEYIKRLALQPNVPQDGHMFEHWVAQRLRSLGWHAVVTQGSGDQGLDIVCSKNGFQFGIQCKRVSKPTGNKAVQEVISGGVFHGVSNLAVVSSAGFTKGAVDLANKANVILLLPGDLAAFDDYIQK